MFSRKNNNILPQHSEDIVDYVDQLIRKCVSSRASDIHFEPFLSGMRIRCRIDGQLNEIEHLDVKTAQKVIARIKILVGADIGQSRLPQDGKFHFLIDGKHFDIRVSLIPTIFGEKAVLRLLNKSQAMMSLSELGLLDWQLEIYRRSISRPFGLILITGPTGSGKTTTLYSTINEINDPSKNIVTIEDPVEYEIQGINQIQVNYKVGLDFSRGLRSILRQDPDIILVGEIRDSETAKIAVASAMTGHLVFSTLHTNDAASAVERLIDMGVEPYFVSSAMICVIAQRLVRRICPKCEECNYSGFKGRIGIFEVLYFDDKIREIVKNNVDKDQIINNSKMVKMFDAGMILVKKGLIQKSDLFAVTFGDPTIFS